MLDVFVMIVPALLVSLAAKLLFPKTITTEEALVMLGLNVLVALLFNLGTYAYGRSQMYDTQLLSGYVMSKNSAKVSCEHSYDCRCRTIHHRDGKGNRYTTRECDTCYEHSYDVSWRVKTTLSDYTIPRVDRRGLTEPQRWTVVKVDEPVVETSGYMNYLLADEHTLFVETLTPATYDYPEYPQVYDMWNVRRVIGVPEPLGSTLNTLLNETLKTLGPAKQLNVVVVATKHNEDFYTGLMAKWKGGKKNDVIMVYGVDDNMNTLWFKSNSYAMGMGNMLLHAKLADNAVGHPLDVKALTLQLATISTTYARLSASEFEFKANSIDTSFSTVLLLTLLNIAAAFGLAYTMHKN